jgi:hypothetical protein
MSYPGVLQRFEYNKDNRTVFLYCGLRIPQTLQVTNLPCLTASCAKFLRTVYPRGGTSIMLSGWVCALMEGIALDCPGSK